MCLGIDSFVCSLIDIRVGFETSASLFEMIKYIDKPIYFLLIGALSSVLMYFAAVLVLSKYDLENHRILPKSVRQLTKYLGGEENISSIDNGLVYVKNPNLIDILIKKNLPYITIKNEKLNLILPLIHWVFMY